MRGSRSVPITAIGLFLFPALAFAQAAPMATEQRPMYELPTLTVAAPDGSPMDARAAELYQAGDWAGAANLYRDAAEGMPKNDPASYAAYDMAARLYFYGKEYDQARASMEEAAAVAEATGDIVSAAYRHVDAAFIAVWEGYPGNRRDHIQKAERLAATEGFGAQHAARIDALIQGVAALPLVEGASN